MGPRKDHGPCRGMDSSQRATTTTTSGREPTSTTTSRDPATYAYVGPPPSPAVAPGPSRTLSDRKLPIYFLSTPSFKVMDINNTIFSMSDDEITFDRVRARYGYRMAGRLRGFEPGRGGVSSNNNNNNNKYDVFLRCHSIFFSI